MDENRLQEIENLAKEDWHDHDIAYGQGMHKGFMLYLNNLRKGALDLICEIRTLKNREFAGKLSDGKLQKIKFLTDVDWKESQILDDQGYVTMPFIKYYGNLCRNVIMLVKEFKRLSNRK